MKTEVNKLEENAKYKNIREIYKGTKEFKKGYTPRAFITKIRDGTVVCLIDIRKIAFLIKRATSL